MAPPPPLPPEHQPGLQVTSLENHRQPDLEVDRRDAASGDAPIPVYDGPVKQGGWRRYQRWIVAVLVLVVVAAVAGGVAGGILAKRNRHKESATTSTVEPPDTTKAFPSATVSAISATATVMAETDYNFPTPVTWTDGQPEMMVFCHGSDHAIYNKRRDPEKPDHWLPDEGFEYMGGSLSAAVPHIAGNSRGEGYINLFVVASDGTIYSKEWDNGLVSWVPALESLTYLGGPKSKSSPTVASWSSNKVDVFLIGEDQALYTLSRSGNSTAKWRPPQKLGGKFSSLTPAAVSWEQGRLDVFAVGTDLKLYTRYWAVDSNEWKPTNNEFASLSGTCTSRPIAVSYKKGRIDLFVRGGDARLWHIYYDQGKWSDWLRVGDTQIQAEPDAIVTGPNRIDVFAWGLEDRALLHRSFDGNSWTPENGFENLAGDLGAPPKAAGDTMGGFSVFAYDRHGNVVTKAWNETTKDWRPKKGFLSLGMPKK
ncbi:fucose-specific lectin [Wilcoxina mikolae CBS 423.85]|nr:fucose-specific lectin [Wilcoxina mikolae CBS 423.85]